MFNTDTNQWSCTSLPLLTKKYFVCASIDDDLVCRETIPFEVGLIGNTNKETEEFWEPYVYFDGQVE